MAIFNSYVSLPEGMYICIYIYIYAYYMYIICLLYVYIYICIYIYIWATFRSSGAFPLISGDTSIVVGVAVIYDSDFIPPHLHQSKGDGG